MPEFNQRLYEASLDALLLREVPKELAETASNIVARDDASLPNLGRTAEDQTVMRQIVDIINADAPLETM
ncbi:hypothetical protein H6G36_02275 [Anabaena minutissima FACHB-250]|nr:hypothetical protein [Anabaena minutissima FACHB-250]